MEYNKIPNVVNNEVVAHIITADITKIKKDKLKFSKEFIEKALKKNPSLESFFANY